MKESTIIEANKCMMTCNTRELKDTMRFLSVAVPKTAKGKLYNCEITIKTNEVIFVVIGASKSVYCKTVSPAKVSLSFRHLYEVIKDMTTVLTHIEVKDSALSIGNITLNAKTCFFEDDSILRSIQLPMKYTPVDLFRAWDLYTEEELEFNGLTDISNKVFIRCLNDIQTVFKALKKYGFTRERVENIIYTKIYPKSKYPEYYEKPS